MNILNNKISHAYIFDSNGNSLVMEMVMSFVKQIICMDIKQDDIKENISYYDILDLFC